MAALHNGNVVPITTSPAPGELERARAVALRALVQTYFDQVCYPDLPALVAAEARYIAAAQAHPRKCPRAAAKPG